MSTWKKFIKALVFCLIIVLLFFPVASALGKGSVTCAIQTFYKQEKNTADVVVIGSSTIRADWIAVQAWKDTSLNCYSLSSADQPLPAIKYLIREARKTQDPELFVIDLRAATKGDGSKVKEGAIRRVTDNMKFSFNRCEMIDECLSYAGIKTENHNMDYYFDFLYYHSRWKDFISKTTEAATADDEAKGAPMAAGYPLDKLQLTVLDTTGENMGWREDVEPYLAEDTKAQFQALLDEIKKEKINVLFLIPPMQFGSQTSANLRYVTDWVKKEGYPIYDATKHYEEMGIDYATDFRNKRHLNHSGAVKFTRVFSKYLKDNYSFHHQENAAQTALWEKYYKDYEGFFGKDTK